MTGSNDLISLFREAVRRTPEAIAIEHEDGNLTYSELDLLSSSLQSELKANGVGSGSCVILVTAHGTRNIVSILAILKCGASYAPVDRETWSTQRIGQVIQTLSDSPLIVNTTPTPFQFESRRILHIDSLSQLRSTVTPHASERSYIPPDADACMIFTSGSTGVPKGVILPHRAIANYAVTSPFNMNVQPGDKVLHILSVAFDASTGMLFSIICNSGTVVPTSMNDLYEDAVKCTILASTPSILSSLPVPCPQRNPYTKVHTVLLGGETPPLDLLKGWMSIGTKILNAYGPTEATTACVMQIVEVNKETEAIRSSIIGKPMRQCPVYILDENDEEITHKGTDGELVVSGCCLAKGYYKNPAKTAAAFVTWKDRRIYRTGDLARWTTNSDGSRVLEFRGRKDRTVKNRGFLVNLETDVEAALQNLHPGIENIHATLVDKLLVALVVPATLDTCSLRQRANAQLSAFHVPDRILAVERLPLSPNGKIDSRKIEELVRSMDEQLAGDGFTIAETDSPIEIVRRCMANALQIPLHRLRSDADFFALGGNSLSALKLASLCRSNGFQISPRDVYTARTCECISGRGKEISNDGAMVNGSHSPSIDDDSAPLTSQQLALCIPTMEWPGKNCNQLRKRYALEQAKSVRAAWKRVWEVEPLFRTEVSLDEGTGVQKVQQSPIHSLNNVRCFTRDEYMQAVKEASLDVGLGIKIDLVTLEPADDAAEPGEMSLILTAHHAVLDGYSLAVLLAKVNDIMKGQDPMPSGPFPPVARRLLAMQQDRDQEARSFWIDYLKDVPASAEFTLKAGQVPRAARATETRFDLGNEAEALVSLAAAHNVTLASIYYTAWAMVVSAHTGHSRTVIGAVHSGRQSLLEHVDAVGQLMTTLPLVVDLKPEATVSEQLSQVMLDLARCAEFSWCTPDQVNYKMTNLMAMQFDLPEHEAACPAIDTWYYENTDFPLSLLVDQDAQFRLVGQYTESALNGLAVEFKTALHSLIQHQSMGACVLTTAHERSSSAVEQSKISLPSTAMHSISTTAMAPTPTHSTLVSAFESSADLHGDLIAVDGPDASLTYEQLDSLANVVANDILRVCPGAKTVAIYADGSTRWIIGILGILKAGCAYCPIDPAYPNDRKASVYSRSGSAAIVVPCSAQAPEIAALGADATAIVVEDSIARKDSSPRRPGIQVDTASDSLIVFTSGTTGQPKGVPISHRGLLALQSNPEATMFSRPALRIAQYMSPAFDYCSNEIFSALLHGATLVLKDPSDPNAHLKRADAVTITPSVLAVLDPADFPNLRVVYATGEPVSPALVSLWGPGRLFINAYGPAECSICTSFTRLVPGQPVTIGRAIKTARMYILDPQRRRVDTGVRGEIYLAGTQVMRGYIGATEEQQAKVVADPWHAGERMYRTGDYGMWNEDGNIVYLGRIDRQVKVRGYRVELPAVEQKIQEVDTDVILAVALVVNESLVAFVKPSSIDVNALRERLCASLQPSWVPRRILAMDELPMTANRKVDSRALEKLTHDADAKESTQDVKSLKLTPVEEAVAMQWRAILKLDMTAALSASHDFVDLGGNSVLQMLLAVRLSKLSGAPISVRDVITTPRLGDQARLLESRGEKPQAMQENRQHTALSVRQLTPLELQAWFQYQIGTSKTTFNIPVVLHIDGTFDRAKLVEAFDCVLETRTLFRSNFITVNGTPTRVLRCRAPRVRQTASLDVEAELNTEFDISKDELIRVFLSGSTLMVKTSHMIADLDSVQVLLREVSRIYNGGVCDGPRFKYLDSPTWSYKVSKQENDYWTTTLRGVPESYGNASLPVVSLYEGRSIVETYSGDIVRQLRTLMDRQSVTPHQLASAAIAQMLQWLWQTDDVVLGCPYGNRHSAQDRDSCGLFLERLPLRIKSSANESCEDLLKSTREASQQALAHAIPFHKLLAALNIAPNLDHHPLFQAMVTFHPRNLLESCLEIPNCHISREHCYPPGSKFLLMFEWTEVDNDEWLLRIEYNSARITEKQINTIRQALRTSIDAFAAGFSREKIHASLDERFAAAAQLHRPHTLRERFTYTIRKEMTACLGIKMKDFPCTVSFFEAGGTSISACCLQSQLRRVGLDVSIRNIFDHPTADGLARLLVG